MEFMLTYNDIHHLDLTFIIQETNQFVMNLLRENNNMIANDLQVTLNIKDYYQNAIVRLDVDLIITYLKGINRPPTKEEEKDVCTICFENYISVNNICFLICSHNFHFLCIGQWLRTNIICSVYRESNL